MRILVVEDESRIADFLSRGLVSAGYAVDVAATGGSAIDMIHSTDYDLVILDLGLPDVDGLTVLQKIRNRKVSPPVLILSARDAVDDRVKGLEGGADDYLVKPFAIQELRARLRALLRRELPHKTDRLAVADLSLDPAAHAVTRGGQAIGLTAREFALLEYFMRNPDCLITRQMAEDHVWSYDFLGGSNVVDVYVRRLRRKIDDPFAVKLIETVRGAGYRLCRPLED
jgi:DNA-binding response OmpR family regulator